MVYFSIFPISQATKSFGILFALLTGIPESENIYTWGNAHNLYLTTNHLTQRRQYEGHNTLLTYYTDHRAMVSIYDAKGCIVA